MKAPTGSVKPELTGAEKAAAVKKSMRFIETSARLARMERNGRISYAEYCTQVDVLLREHGFFNPSMEIDEH